ncbi:MORN repeat-containing protein [Roseateles sp. DC23W]|uniref:MORN repeat-containing protein n=1 Tax=Pelomonas dachongensis TaxID=3299029 RepID=A0ABW7EJX6_9BURK
MIRPVLACLALAASCFCAAAEVQTDAQGNRFEGSFVNGRLAGRGTAAMADGSRYEGEFADGRFHGRGVQTWLNGSRYEGDYVDGRRSGMGVYVYPDGTRYEGQFANGRLAGKGVMTWRDGDRYEGEFFDGARTGVGVMRLAGGDRYEGEFADGVFSGEGVLVKANGQKLDGRWAQGEFIGHRSVLRRGLEGAGLHNVSYAVPPAQKTAGPRVLVAASFEERPVHLLREGARGSGGWTVFVGAATDRVRLTVDDRRGLTGALAMDKGQRLTVRQVHQPGQERIEYRLYDAERRFIAGAVMYRHAGGWTLGRLRTEAFWGYAELADLEDVSAQMGVDTTARARTPQTITALLQAWWQRVDLIPAAHAQTGLLDGFFSQSAQDARERWAAPLHEMFKASLVGGAAFTVKLAGQTLAAGETAALIGAASPFLVAVGTGVAIGIAADHFYQWAQARNLEGSSAGTAMRQLFARLTADTRYSQLPDPHPPAGQSAGGTPPVPARAQAADSAAFRQALARGTACAKARDFGCAEDALATAQQQALTAQQRRELVAGWQQVDGEKNAAEIERSRPKPPVVAQTTAVPAQPPAAVAVAPQAAGAAPTPNTAPAQPTPPAKVASCLDELQGTWSHDTGGSWTFDGARATLVQRSVNQGGSARQTTVLAISSCDGGTLRYRIVRATLQSDGYNYDKTEANDRPPTINWAKVYTQPYSLSGSGLKLGNFTYGR